MKKIMFQDLMAKVLRTLRNNWKKSVFAAGCLYFAGKWAINKHWEHELRRTYCEEAKKYGSQTVPMGARLRRVTVFLNPAANKGEALKLYEKNAAPILHMAGLQVSLMKTEFEGQVKKYMKVLEDTDAILVAGGDGTLLEVVTGMMRRDVKDGIRNIPVGVIPLGKSNRFAREFSGRAVADAELMMNSAMSVVKMIHRPVDVMHIQSLENDEADVYALTGLRWSTLYQANRNKSKYWYVGPLKDRLSYLLATLRVTSEMRQVRCNISTTPPCTGCSRCLPPPPPAPPKRWWHAFQQQAAPSSEELRLARLRQLENPSCGVETSDEVVSSELALLIRRPDVPGSQESQHKERGMHLLMAPEDESQLTFFTNGMRRVRHDEEELAGSSVQTTRTVTLIPDSAHSGSEWFVIDNEEYEVLPSRVTWIGNAINILGTSETLVTNPPSKGTMLWDLIDCTKFKLGYSVADYSS